MKSSNLTIYYIVGGHEQHYKNMFANMVSAAELGFKGKFLIWEIGEELDAAQIKEKYQIENDIRVLHRANEIDFSKPGKKGYLFWKQKYKAPFEIDTEYAMYVDTDTLFVNNTIDSILEDLGDKIAATTHFWVPTIKHFELMAVPSANTEAFQKMKEKVGLNDEHFILAGGCYFFKMSEENKKIFEEVLEIYDDVYSSHDDYIQGITDEVFFSHVVQTHGKELLLSGATNHCFMGNDKMPLVWQDDNLYGGNPYEKQFSKIMLLHCDTSRRDPSENYAGEIKENIQKILSKYEHILK